MTAGRAPTEGWVVCDLGHRHWGLAGAAGLLLAARRADGGVAVLLQHRAPWVHLGDTWSTPGGARLSGESAVDAAFREVIEETGLALADEAEVIDSLVDDHGGWSYTTVCAALHEQIQIAERNEPIPWTPRGEQQGLRWVQAELVDELPLHPGFAATWPLLRPLIE